MAWSPSGAVAAAAPPAFFIALGKRGANFNIKAHSSNGLRPLKPKGARSAHSKDHGACNLLPAFTWSLRAIPHATSRPRQPMPARRSAHPPPISNHHFSFEAAANPPWRAFLAALGMLRPLPFIGLKCAFFFFMALLPALLLAAATFFTFITVFLGAIAVGKHWCEQVPLQTNFCHTSKHSSASQIPPHTCSAQSDNFKTLPCLLPYNSHCCAALLLLGKGGVTLTSQ